MTILTPVVAVTLLFVWLGAAQQQIPKPLQKSTNIIESLSHTYATVLAHFGKPLEEGFDEESMNVLLKLHDDDATCHDDCRKVINSYITKYRHALINKIHMSPSYLRHTDN